MNTGPFGSELTREPFRWDQRLFAIVLALPAQASSATQTTIVPNTPGSAANDTSANQFIPPASDQPVTAMCDVTGGECFPFLFLETSTFDFFRSFISDHFTTFTQSMFRISCTKNSTWCCCESRKSND